MKLSPWEPDLRTVVDRIADGDIDLQPDFQRQEIWALSKKRKLIDTIFRGWSIPPVFLVVLSDGRMEVLDGQQRLAAIRDFADSKFGVDGRISPSDAFIYALNGKNYKRLAPTERRQFDNYTLRCFKLTDYSPDEPSELFYRLNQPSMLTAGEQRNAFYGPAREQLKQLVSIFEGLGNDKVTIGFSNVRLAYDDIIARLLFFAEAERFDFKGTEALISQRFKWREPFSERVVFNAQLAITAFSEARQNSSVVRLNKASALSWLLFYYRSAQAPQSREFLSHFQYLEGNSTNYTPSLTEALAVFQDRASLRVTDVSSVTFRDFCLWYLFVFSARGVAPDAESARILSAVHAAAENSPGETFAQILERLVAVDRWSRLP